MTRSTRWIFRKCSEPVSEGHLQRYASLNPTTSPWNEILGLWCSQQVGSVLGPIQSLVLYPSAGRRVIKHVGGVNWGRSPNRGLQGARESPTKRYRLIADRRLWEAALAEPLPRKWLGNSYLKPCMSESSRSQNGNFRPADLEIFRRFSNGFDTHLKVPMLIKFRRGNKSPFFEHMYVMVSQWASTQSWCPDFKRGFECVVYAKYILYWRVHDRSATLEQLV